MHSDAVEEITETRARTQSGRVTYADAIILADGLMVHGPQLDRNDIGIGKGFKKVLSRALSDWCPQTPRGDWSEGDVECRPV